MSLPTLPNTPLPSAPNSPIKMSSPNDVSTGASSSTAFETKSKPLSFAEEIGFDVVHITVGSTVKKTFVVYKAPLCHKVAYFDHMFNGNWREAQSQTANLPEDVCEAFALFVIWVIKDKIELPVNSETDSSIPTLIHLFAFAEKYNITTLADQTLERLSTLMLESDCLPIPSDIELAYDITHENSKLRSFMLKLFVYITFHSDESEDVYGWSKATMQPLMQSCTDLCTDFFATIFGQGAQEKKDPRGELGCDLHQHREDEDCPYKQLASPTHVKPMLRKGSTSKKSGSPLKKRKR
ncbi:uncharacterized protein PAC_16659 [Phialocephala subalpina]|uniref:BTB domain-containing protein n=1 Tax=Phialocephala subalpina TaxID=576137 RepID=A0A1L7XP09_9HELO|nr:uncharacterized protein PAC_16659 [Phialocephala subalpina]